MTTTIGIYISYHLLFRLITLDYERRSDIINCQLLILTSQNIFKWETWLNPSQDQKILATCLAGSFDFDKTFLSSFEFWLKKSVIPNQLQFYHKIILNQHRSSLPGPVISVRSEPGLTPLNRDWILGEEPCQEHSDWTGLCFAFLLLSVELLTTS